MSNWSLNRADSGTMNLFEVVELLASLADKSLAAVEEGTDRYYSFLSLNADEEIILQRRSEGARCAARFLRDKRRKQLNTLK